jgi:hypothetical protein
MAYRVYFSSMCHGAAAYEQYSSRAQLAATCWVMTS